MIDAVRLTRWRRRPSDFCREVLDFNPTVDQAKFLDDMSDFEIDRAIISSPRGCGKTRALAALAVWGATVIPFFTKQPYRVLILSCGSEQAESMYDYVKDFIQGSEFVSGLVSGEPLKRETRFRSGSYIRRLTTSERSVVAKHVELLCLDEANRIKDERLILEALPIVEDSPIGRVVMASTPYEYWHLFTDIWRHPDRWGFKRYRFVYENAPWKDRESFERARQTLPEHLFRIHYLGEPTPVGGNVFDLNALRDLCMTDTKPRRIKGSPVMIGVDWGWVDHPTAAVVLQEQHGDHVVLSCKAWRKKDMELVHRELRSLAEEWKARMFIADRAAPGENERLRKAGFNVKEVAFKGMKDLMIGRTRGLIKEGKVKIWSGFRELLKELAAYSYDTKRGDDRVDALMLALLGTYRSGTIVYPVKGDLVRKDFKDKHYISLVRRRRKLVGVRETPRGPW